MSTLINSNLYSNMVLYFGVGVKKKIKWYSKFRKKCLRLIKRVNNRVSCRGLFSDFGILTVTSLYIFETLCYLKKNKIYTTLYSDVHSYNTVHKHNLYVQLCTTSRCKKKCN
jgi:hypothetical protein